MDQHLKGSRIEFLKQTLLPISKDYWLAVSTPEARSMGIHILSEDFKSVIQLTEPSAVTRNMTLTFWKKRNLIVLTCPDRIDFYDANDLEKSSLFVKPISTETQPATNTIKSA